MVKFLGRLFIKDYKKVNNPKVRRSYGSLAAIFGIITNVILAAMKIVIGVLTGAISITADGLNNLSDSSSSIVSLIGFKIAGKPADEDHPFGHARMEYLAGFMVSMLIVILGFELIVTSIKEILNPTSSSIDIILISIILGISILIKLYQMFFYIRVSKMIKSDTIRANAADSRNDVITTSVVLIGLIISYFTKIELDGYLGTGVGLFILVSGIKLVIDTMQPLLGQKPDPKMVKELVKLITSHKGILGIHDLQVHAYGPNTFFASCHVEVDASVNVLVSHDLVDNIEHDCMENLHINTVLHMDPIVINDPLTDEIKGKVKEIMFDLPIHITMHDFRIVTGPTHTNIVFDIVVPHQKQYTDRQIVGMIKRRVKKLDPSYNAIIDVDQDYSDFLANGNYEEK